MMNKTMYVISGSLAILGLSACGASNTAHSPAPDTTTVTVTTEKAHPGQDSSSPITAGTPAVPYTNEDIKTAIDHALKQYPDGVVTSLDANDSGTSFGLDLVVGTTVHELQIDRSGKIFTEASKNEPNDSDVLQAKDAQVSALEAINGALENRDGVIVDSAELDHDSGRLAWKIELKDAGGQELTKVFVNAVDGSMSQ